jgi:hypothetical protein
MNIQRCLEILELESVSSPEELKRAYRALVQIWHPDRFHGNTRLEKNAGEKLREITLAYKHLLTYFDPSQSKRLRTSTSDLQDDSMNLAKSNKAVIQSRNQSQNFSSHVNDSHGVRSTQFSGFRLYPARRASLVRRYLKFGFLCLLLGVSGLIVYFLLNMDPITSKTRGPSSEALERLKIGEKKKEVIKRDGPSVQKITRDPGKELAPLESDNYYEIYLDSGNVIMTESWWQEDDMIMYKKYGGSMGIEKTRVKKIVKR